ncbi:hypothetical protein [Streptomyces rubradiris]|uniref:DNA-binding phage zinc finger domain-containing protein n=1 Tax=Streptomyces rubradiris TaxID=285531 RepID=A0ABQ3R3E3_STRRR|nr:hypothetical protein [Streptomyces rubradiris]GHH30041.1 hypothetical protein GCM10018792_75950 [Streptomyces rubradiris]GHI50376.1 hypothetical protein Srubr_02220 [Streptomyces rubradiris]
MRALIHSTTTHPARTIACPHCHAPAGRPCTLRTTGQHLPEPHPKRISAWAQQTAVCPTCQVEPTVPCHDDGRARHTVHNRRYQEAEETAA